MNKETLLLLLVRAAQLLRPFNPGLDGKANDLRREWLRDYDERVKQLEKSK